MVLRIVNTDLNHCYMDTYDIWTPDGFAWTFPNVNMAP